MIVSHKRIEVEELGKRFKTIGKASAKAGEKIATTVMKNPAKALETGTKTGTAALSKIPKAALSSKPDMINFYHTGERLCLRTIV